MREGVNPGRLRPSDTPLLLGSYARLNHFTGWTPEISFDQMLDDLFGYWRTVVAAS